MKLYATPLSHFSRKVRILLDLYEAPYELINIGNVVSSDAELFANNPLMKVPILVDGKEWIIESDHIAKYVVQKFDSSDRYNVRTENITDLNVRAVLNGIMNEEVKVILARRSGLATEHTSFFDKALKAIHGGFQWLEDNHHVFHLNTVTYKEIHLVCLWDHIAHYNLVPLPFPRLQDVVTAASVDKRIKLSAPTA